MTLQNYLFTYIFCLDKNIAFENVCNSFLYMSKSFEVPFKYVHQLNYNQHGRRKEANNTKVKPEEFVGPDLRTAGDAYQRLTVSVEEKQLIF